MKALHFKTGYVKTKENEYPMIATLCRPNGMIESKTLSTNNKKEFEKAIKNNEYCVNCLRKMNKDNI